MSHKEAIRTIEFAISKVEWECPMDYAAAFDTAISALRAQQEAERRTTMPDLKPCPFCGGEARIFNAFGTKVECKVCGVKVYDLYVEKAFAKWNRRVVAPKKEALK